jgi:hypothetical protein
MAPGAGFSGIAKVGSNSLGDAAKNVSIKRNRKMIDVTTLSDEDDEFMTGRGNVSGSIEVLYDATVTAVTDLITAEDAGTSVTLDIGPASTLHWSGTAYISNLSFDNDGSDATKLKFDFQGSGAFTKQTS